jgi:hypothetical protein
MSIAARLTASLRCTLHVAGTQRLEWAAYGTDSIRRTRPSLIYYEAIIGALVNSYSHTKLKSALADGGVLPARC